MWCYILGGPKYKVNGKSLNSIDVQWDLSIQPNSSMEVETDIGSGSLQEGMLLSIGQGINLKSKEVSCRFTIFWLGCIWSVVCSFGRSMIGRRWRLWIGADEINAEKGFADV